MSTKRHSNTRAQAHVLTEGMRRQQLNKSEGKKHRALGGEKMGREVRKAAKEMRKAESGEDSRAKGTSQIDTEKLMRNCKEGCV